METKATPDLSAQAPLQPPHQPRRRPSLDKKHLQGFLAGLIAGALLLTGTFAAFNPDFLKGTFTTQIGSRTLQTEVDLQTVTCSPSSIVATTAVNQTVVLQIANDALQTIKPETILLDGLFKGLSITSAQYASGQLTVHIQGKPLLPRVYGSDQVNPDGVIYVLPGVDATGGLAYEARLTAEYPQLVPEQPTVLPQASYHEAVTLALNGDTFKQAPTAADITLAGGFAGLTVSDVRQNGQLLHFTINGSAAASETGNGLVILAGQTLTSGFELDQVIRIAGTASLYVHNPLTLEEPFDENLTLNLENDYFAENVTPDMFSLGGVLNGARVNRVERNVTDSSVTLTLEGPSLRQAGTASITADGSALVSGRTVTGTIPVIAPQIIAFSSVNPDRDGEGFNLELEISSYGQDFRSFIGAADIVLQDALAGMQIKKVTWIHEAKIRVSATGPIAAGEGRVSVRAAAMGGVTGAEAVVSPVSDLDPSGLADITATRLDGSPLFGDPAASLSADAFPAIRLSTAVPPAAGRQAGSLSFRWQPQATYLHAGRSALQMPVLPQFQLPAAQLLRPTPLFLEFLLEDLIDWGIRNLKEAVIDMAKAGVKAGATEGLMYLLRQTGLVGPSVSDQLNQINDSINNLQKKIDSSERRVIAAIGSAALATRLDLLKSKIVQINTQYKLYEYLKQDIADFKAAHPGQDPLSDPAIKEQADTLAGKEGSIKTADIINCSLTIAHVMTGDANLGESLITSYYQVMKDTLPFEHNAAAQLRLFVEQMTLVQSKAVLLVGEYCNYNAAGTSALTYNNKLKAFLDDMSESIDAQKRLLPEDSIFKTQNNPLPGDVTVKSNIDGKYYVLLNGKYTMQESISKWILPVYYNNSTINFDIYDLPETIDDRWGSKAFARLLSDRGWGGVNFGPAKADTEALLQHYTDFYATGDDKITGQSFLNRYTGANSVCDWLYAGPVGEQFGYLFLHVRNQEYYIYNTRNNVYEVRNAWDLYDSWPDYHFKYFIVKR